MSEPEPGAHGHIAVHVISIADFDALAAGGGDAGAIHRLIASEQSRRIILIYELLRLLEQKADLLGPLPPVAEAWRLLREIEERSARDLNSVLLHPTVGVWASHTLRRIRLGTTGKDPAWVAAGQIYSVIFAAAMRSNIDVKVPVPVRRGSVTLPSLGLARFGQVGDFLVAEAESRRGGMVLSLDGRSMVVDHAHNDAANWWSVRRLHLRSGGRELKLVLDDVDPYRDLADPVEPHRLDESTLAAWHERIGEAWQIIERQHVGTADAMSAGFWSITPLPENPGWEVRSASTGDAFGAALISLPPDPATAAVTMVHEFQHNKLGALLHLVDLTNSGDRQPRLYAPWRPDPRPVAGLLQGVYAFIGITAFWRAQRAVGSEAERRLADFEFALARRQTWEGMQALRQPGQLTAWGRRFVGGMGERLRPWLRESVPVHANRLAWAASLDHRAGWRLRNLAVDPSWTTHAVTAWMEGRDPPSTGAAKVMIRAGAPIWLLRRLHLYRAAAIGNGTPSVPPAVDADVLLVRGTIERAASDYHQIIAESPVDLDAWAGLGLAVAAQQSRPEGRILLRRPELVYGLHRALADVEPSLSPLTVARWLTS